MAKTCADQTRPCSEGYRCPAHLPTVKAATPDKCAHEWFRFIGVLLKCIWDAEQGTEVL